MQVQMPLSSSLSPTVASKILSLQGNRTIVPDIALVTDIDHSLLPWKEGKYKVEADKEALDGNYNAIKSFGDRILTILVTGLDLLSVKQMKQHFSDSPIIDFLSTDNGKGGLFLNDKGLSTLPWLEKTELSDRNLEWETFVRDIAGWKQDTFLKAVFDELLVKRNAKEEKSISGHIAYPHYSVYSCTLENTKNTFLVISPYESAFFIMKNPAIDDSEKVKQFAIELAKDICEKYYRDSNLKIKFSFTEPDDYFYFFFMPDNGIEINKAAACEFAIKSLPSETRNNLKAGITIGDSRNDTHLQIENLELPGKKQIPFYAIFSGEGLLQDPAFSSHPRKEISSKKGDVGNAIRTVMSRIDRD